MNNPKTASPEPFSYEPPSGGDVTLKSRDGVVFTAHSSFLTLASPVFAAMFEAAQKKVFQACDDAESISLMLRFVYPPAFLGDLSLPLLKKALIMAKKYKIEGMLSTIDYIISHSFDANSMAKLDPVKTFALAAEYKLKSGQKAAAKSIGLFRDSGDFERFARSFPQHSSIVGVLGAQAMRTKALVKVLTSPRGLIARPPTISWAEGGYLIDPDIAICDDCISKLWGEIEPDTEYFPDWMYRWAAMALGELVDKPLDKCEHLFHVSVLREIGDSYCCEDCVKAAREAQGGECFRSWAEAMKREVKDELEKFGSLYEL